MYSVDCKCESTEYMKKVRGIRGTCIVHCQEIIYHLANFKIKIIITVTIVTVTTVIILTGLMYPVQHSVLLLSVICIVE